MAAFVASTEANIGEEGLKAVSTLKEYLSDLPSVYAKLKRQGMTELDIFVFINEKDLEILCGKSGIDLEFMEAVKFKSAVRKLQSRNAQKQKSHIVLLSMAEQKELDKIKIATQQTNDIETIFENHLQQIEDDAVCMKCCVDKEFNNIGNTLQQRKKSLYKQIEEWKMDKLKSINKEISVMLKYKNELKARKKECDQLLKNNNNVKERENKIKSISTQIFDDNKLFEPFNAIPYMIKHTKLTQIKFEANTHISRLQMYGEFKSDINPLVTIPKIELKSATKTSVVNNGYTVKLKWKTSKAMENKRDFMIRFRRLSMNNIGIINDDEKKSDVAVSEWMAAKHKAIKSGNKNDNQFEVDIDNIFQWDTFYNFHIELKILQPFMLVIRSNIVKLMINEKIPKDNPVRIQLQQHSCLKAIDSSYSPKNMLSSNDSVYASKDNKEFTNNENDWVIFKMQQNELYLPTKFTIKNYGASGQGVKRMRILIGDGYNEWFAFKPDTINVAKNGDSQSFNIDGVDHKIVKKNGWRHIKLEFCTNHEYTVSNGCRFVVREFQLHGIKL